MAKRSSPVVNKTVKTVAKAVLGGRRRKLPGLMGILVLLFCFGLLVYDNVRNAQNAPEPPSVDDYDEPLTGSVLTLREGTYRVERVVDGDTIILDGKPFELDKGIRVRLLGVDTPETVKPNWPVEPWGPEASAYTKKRIAENGSVVRLEFDRELKDKYGRFLAYIWLKDADERDSMLNLELVRLGLGRTMPEFKIRRQAEFAAAEQAAQRKRLGIWSGK